MDKTVTGTEDEKPQVENDLFSYTNDSVIEDTDDDNFTRNHNFMKGAPFTQDLLDRVESKMALTGQQFDPDDFNKSDTYHNMLSAHKTQYQSDHAKRDYEFKQDNLIAII